MKEAVSILWDGWHPSSVFWVKKKKCHEVELHDVLVKEQTFSSIQLHHQKSLISTDELPLRVESSLYNFYSHTQMQNMKI